MVLGVSKLLQALQGLFSLDTEEIDLNSAKKSVYCIVLLAFKL